MKTENIKMENGLELQVRAIQIVETYKEEFLLGEPDEYDNIRVRNGINCPDNWRTTACVFNKKDFNIKQPFFDPYTVAIWLRSNQSVNDPEGEFDFSEAVLVFTIESIIDFSVQSVLKSKLKKLEWSKYAKNGVF